MIIIMKYVKYVLMSFIYALLFNLTAYLGAGIASVISIFIFFIIYAAVQLTFFVNLSSHNIKIYCLGVILTICFSVIIGYIFYDTDFFIHIFMAFNGDYGTPNAGSGFGMILSYSLNGIALLCSILIGIYNILTNRQQ